MKSTSLAVALACAAGMANAADMGLAVLWPDRIDPASGQHLWMAGAIGAMTLAVMTRATLGHTGRALTAGKVTVAIYLCVFAAALMRFLIPFHLGLSILSGVFWLLAFGGFVVVYGPMLLRPKAEQVT